MKPRGIDTGRNRLIESADFHFEIITRVEQRDRPALIEPAFQFQCRNALRCVPSRIDAVDAEGDDLLLDLHQHPREGLVGALADLRRQALQPRHGPQFAQQLLDLRAAPSHEEVDPFGAE
jgi:hypothetical protein